MAQLKKLTPDDYTIIIPTLIRLLKSKAVGEENAITQPRIVDWFNNRKSGLKFKNNFNDKRFMKCINHIRGKRLAGMAVICASSNGYWIETDRTIARKNYESFIGRIEAQIFAAKGMLDIVEQMDEEALKLPKPDSLGFLDEEFI